MRNYFYIYGHGVTARVFFVDAARRATVVAHGVLWNHPSAASHGVAGRTTLPIVAVS